jgi:hypothetical protein
MVWSGFELRTTGYGDNCVASLIMLTSETEIYKIWCRLLGKKFI